MDKQPGKIDKEQDIRNLELEDIRQIINIPGGAGIRFFHRLIVAGRIFQSVFTGNSATYFNEGARNFVLRYLDDIVEVSTPQQLILIFFGKKGDLKDGG